MPGPYARGTTAAKPSAATPAITPSSTTNAVGVTDRAGRGGGDQHAAEAGRQRAAVVSDSCSAAESRRGRRRSCALAASARSRWTSPAPRRARRSARPGRRARPAPPGCAVTRPARCTSATSANPARSSATRRRSVVAADVRPCHHEPSAQVTPAGGQRQAGGGRAVAVLHGQRSGMTRLDAEERAGQQPAQRDRRGDARRATAAVPAGSRPRSPHADSASPTTASDHGSGVRCWPGGLEQRDAARHGERAQDAARIGQRARPVGRARAALRSVGTSSAAPTSTNGSRPRNTQRQLACWVSAPDTSGPSSDGSTHADEVAANTFGCSVLGIRLADDARRSR